MDSPNSAPITYPWNEPPAQGDVTEVAPGILWIRLPLPMALDHVNVYAIADDDGWTLIDTGIGTKTSRRIWAELLEGPLSQRPVARVLITHHHPDHVGLAGWFQSVHGAELWASRTSWLFARMLRLDEQAVPPPETLAFWQMAGMDPSVLEARSRDRPFNYADVVAEMPLGFHRLIDRDTIRLGGRDWIICYGQGHAPDQVTLWCATEDLVIGGDQLLPSISPNIGVYVTEPEANPLQGWLTSCADFQIHATDAQLVLPGHKLPFRGLPTRLRQLIENHHGALDRLRDHLAIPRSVGDCFPPLYRREISDGEYGLALVEAIAHINYLRANGEITGTTDQAGRMLWQMRPK